MKKLLLSALIFLIVISSVSYAQENFLYITMDLSSENVITDSNYNVKEFSVTDYINKIGEEYLFTFSYNSEYDFDDFRIKIILPEESIISKQEESLVLSRPVKLSTDGTRIYLEWSGMLKKNQDFTAFAQYSAKKNEINYYMIFCIIAIIVAFIGGYGFKKFKKEKFIKTILSDDEKKIVSLIKKGVETTQDDIKKQLNWSKTKTSKIIRNLEVKKTIVKIPYKKTNKIKLK